MFICPICKREYEKEEMVVKCLSRCYREKHPNQKSKPAPKSEDITTREVSNDILTFFNSF
jgi:hypothetical protein